MRMRRRAAVAFWLLFAADAPSQAGGTADARKVVQAAVAAIGGEAKVSRCQVVVSRGVGTLHRDGRPVPCTFRHAYQLPGQYRLTVVGYDFESTTVLAGGRGWLQFNGASRAMSKEELVESRINLFIDRVVTLVPLLDDGKFTLTTLKEVPVDGAAAVGVNVRCKNCRDVKLFFCKKTRLLRRMLLTVRAGNGEVEEEVLFRDYAEFAGVLRPRKIVTRRNGKVHAAWQVTEYRDGSKNLAAGEFARPVPAKP
jgi:hypothetical protein